MGVLIRLTTHQHITITINIMPIRIIILGIIMAITTFVSCEDILEAERKAFAMCDSDKMVGLTWKEVENCEERFAELIAQEEIDLPSKEAFDNADLNSNGILLFEEWEEFM